MGVVHLSMISLVNTTSGSGTITAPTDGNTLVAIFGSNTAGATLSSITQTGVTWARVTGGQSTAPGGWNHPVEVWIGTSVSSASTTVTIGLGGRSYALVGIYELSGGMLLDGSPAYSGTSSGSTATTGTTSTADSSGVFLSGIWADSQAATLTAGSPFTGDGTNNNAQMAGAYASYAPGSATASQSETWTLSGGLHTDNVIVSFKSNITTNTHTAAASAALLATNTHTTAASAALLASLTHTAGASAALLATLTHGVAASAALTGPIVKPVSASAALLASNTHTAAASAALLASLTHTAGASAYLAPARSAPASAALLARLTHTVGASAYLFAPQTVNSIALSQRSGSVPGSSASDSVPGSQRSLSAPGSSASVSVPGSSRSLAVGGG